MGSLVVDLHDEIRRRVVFPNRLPGIAPGVHEVEVIGSVDFVCPWLVESKPLLQIDPVLERVSRVEGSPLGEAAKVVAGTDVIDLLAPISCGKTRIGCLEGRGLRPPCMNAMGFAPTFVMRRMAMTLAPALNADRSGVKVTSRWWRGCLR